MHRIVGVNIMPELKKNVLNFGYIVNFKYKGMLSYSFDGFYVVAKYEIPKIENLKLTTFSFDLMCNHLNISKKSYLLRYIRHCRRIAAYVKLYKQQIDYYNQTAYNILQNETGLILPNFNNNNNNNNINKRFITTILGTIVSKVIGLAFEGIWSFLHHKRHKALHKAVKQINERKDLEHNKIYHLEDTMIMYGKYNSDTLLDLIDTVHKMQNVTTWKEKILISKMNEWLKNELAHIHNEFDFYRHYFVPIYNKREICKIVWKIYSRAKILLKSNQNTFKRLFVYFFNNTLQIRSNFGTSKNNYNQNK